MTINTKHSMYNRMMNIAKDISRHATEISGLDQFAWVSFLENLDVSFSLGQIWRPCRSCCFMILNKCIGAVSSPSYCVYDVPDAGDIAEELVLHAKRFCEGNCE